MEKKPFDANEKKIQMLKKGRGNGIGHSSGKDMQGTVRHGIRTSMRNRGKKSPLPPESRFFFGVYGHVSGMAERRVIPGGVQRSSKTPNGKGKNRRIGDSGPPLFPTLMFDIPISPKRSSKPGKQDLEAECRLERVYHKFFRRPIKPKGKPW